MRPSVAYGAHSSVIVDMNPDKAYKRVVTSLQPQRTSLRIGEALYGFCTSQHSRLLLCSPSSLTLTTLTLTPNHSHPSLSPLTPLHPSLSSLDPPHSSTLTLPFTFTLTPHYPIRPHPLTSPLTPHSPIYPHPSASPLTPHFPLAFTSFHPTPHSLSLLPPTPHPLRFTPHSLFHPSPS